MKTMGIPAEILIIKMVLLICLLVQFNPFYIDWKSLNTGDRNQTQNEINYFLGLWLTNS